MTCNDVSLEIVIESLFYFLRDFNLSSVPNYILYALISFSLFYLKGINTVTLKYYIKIAQLDFILYHIKYFVEILKLPIKFDPNHT